jgi:hypothetical protein
MIPPVKRISILTAFIFACATVRVPVAPLGEPSDAPGTIAPPLTELWLESSEEVPPDQARKAEAQARAALASALAGREVSSDAAGASDAVLFVRERAVALTGARRSQQTWAKVGIVAGVVVVIAVAVFGLTRGGDPASARAAKTPAPVSVKPRAVPVAPTVRPLPSVGRAVPLPRVYSPSPVFVGFSVNFWVAPSPLVLAPEPEEEQWYAPGPPPPLLADAAGGDEPRAALADAPPAPDSASEPDGEAGPPPPPMELPGLLEPLGFRVEDRGFFAGPVTALQLDLVDRSTGRAVWSKAVKADADPLDAAAVAKVLDEALAGQAWARRAR